MHSSDPLEKSKRSVAALRKRMERLQKNIRRLYESADRIIGNAAARAERNVSRD